MYHLIGQRILDYVHQDFYFIMKHVQMNLKKLSKIINDC